MPVSVTCPTCSRLLAVPDQLVGKAVRCPQCQAVVPTSLPAAPLAASAAAPAHLPTARFLDQGTRWALLGAWATFVAIAGTAAVQIFALVETDYPEHPTFDLWARFIYAAEGDAVVQGAHAVRYLGTLAVLAGAALAGWGLWQCAQARPEKRDILWLLGASGGLVGAVGFALLPPWVLWLFAETFVAHRGNHAADAVDLAVVTVKLLLLAADAAALASLACLSEFFGGALRRRGNARLAWQLRIFVAVAAATQLFVVGIDLFSGVLIYAVTSDQSDACARHWARTTYGFGLWFVLTGGLLTWATVLKGQVGRGLRYAAK